MNEALTISQIIVVIALIVLIMLITKQKSFGGMYYFIIYSISILIMNIGYLFQLQAGGQEAMELSIKVQYLGGCFTLVLYLVFLYDFYHMPKPKILLDILVYLNFFIFLIVVSFEQNTLLFQEFHLLNSESNNFAFKSGPVLSVFILIQTIEALLIVFVTYQGKKNLTKDRKKKNLGFEVACIVPFVIFFLNLLKENEINIVPYAYVLMVFILFITISRNELFDAVEIAGQMILENTKEGVVLVDKEMSLLDYNNLALELFPMLSVHKIGLSVNCICPELFKMFENKDETEVIINGRYYNCRISGLYHDSATQGYMAWFFDVTKEHQYTKELLYKKTQAEELNSIKSQFLSRMSHEMRTPMNGIIGMTRIAKGAIEDEKKVGKCLDCVLESSNYLMLLMNDILDMSKIESGAIVLNEERFSISEFIHSMLSMFEPDLIEKKLSFHKFIDPAVEPFYIGDSLRIKQIITNILSNAVKFTGKKGKIQFYLEQSPLTKEECYLIFTIADTGIGMNKDSLERIFHPFEQADKTITARFGGTGLGLSISKQLAELMGGTICVTSEKGKGSTFRITLKVKKVEQLEENPVEIKKEENGEQMFQNVTGLLAEDNLINIEVAKLSLELKGIKLDVAHDGKEVVTMYEKSSEGQYQFILMDINMPEMNGFEATKMIREMDRAEAKQIPIIAMSASAFELDHNELDTTGITEHLTKPVDANKLIDLLQTYLK